MKKSALLLSLYALILLTATGCNNKAAAVGAKPQQEASATPSGASLKEPQTQSPAIQQGAVPDWLFEAIKEKFKSANANISDFKKEEITAVQVHMKDNVTPQIAAYATLDRLNGVFVLYDFIDGIYKEVYSANEPIYGIQVFGGGKQFVSYTSGFGGTGIQENYFHLIGHTSKGFKEVWKGNAENIMFGGPLPYHRILGSINLDMQTMSLIHTEYKEIYNTHEAEKPDEVKVNTQLYKFDEQKEEFELVK